MRFLAKLAAALAMTAGLGIAFILIAWFASGWVMVQGWPDAEWPVLGVLFLAFIGMTTFALAAITREKA